jgi:hypothetical protein
MSREICDKCGGFGLILKTLPDESPFIVNCGKCKGEGYLLGGHPETPLTRAVRETVNEYKRAISIYKPFASYHEGYSIILEEEQELWDEIKKKPTERRKEKLRGEAIQLATMSLRFVVDLCS